MIILFGLDLSVSMYNNLKLFFAVLIKSDSGFKKEQIFLSIPNTIYNTFMNIKFKDLGILLSGGKQVKALIL